MDTNDYLGTKLRRKRLGLLSLHGVGALTRQAWGVTRLGSLTSVSVLGTAQEERTTMLWWAGLCGASLLNVGMWLVAARVELPNTQYRAWQLVLSGIYVAVCAFRS